MLRSSFDHVIARLALHHLIVATLPVKLVKNTECNTPTQFLRLGELYDPKESLTIVRVQGLQRSPQCSSSPSPKDEKGTMKAM